MYLKENPVYKQILESFDESSNPFIVHVNLKKL